MTHCPNCGHALQAPRPRLGLTKIQKRALDFIAENVARKQVPPTYAEIAAHLGLSSKSNIGRIMQQLEMRGHINRLGGHARAISVVGATP